MSADDYFRALWRSHLQVSTASHESLGVSTLEAMYCGCCCVLPDVGSYREITGGTGVHPETDIADHLHAMAADPAAREDVAKRQRLASEYYAPERIADRVVAAIAR
jgi:glycosyltransferase involved in cell wall biosynthesis